MRISGSLPRVQDKKYNPVTSGQMVPADGDRWESVTSGEGDHDF